MRDQIVVGVIVLLIGSLLAWLGGVFGTAKRIRTVKKVTRRAWKDYAEWSRRAEIEHEREMERIEERAALDPAPDAYMKRDAWKDEAIDKLVQDQHDANIKLARTIDDAFEELRRVDAVWVVLTQDQRPPFRRLVKELGAALWSSGKSFEEDVIEPMQKRFEEEIEAADR